MHAQKFVGALVAITGMLSSTTYALAMFGLLLFIEATIQIELDTRR